MKTKGNDKCCGGCVHFRNEDIEGRGWCYKRDTARHCSDSCGYYERYNNKFKTFGLTEEGKYFADSEIPGGDCILFPSRDNRDWEAFERELEGAKETVQYVPVSENGVSSGYYQVVGTTEINLDHEYYKELPYIDFQIDGEKYRVSTEDIKRLAIGNADNKTEHISCQSFDETAEPDRPMMAAVIMSGMMAGGSKDKGVALVNKALHLADLILDETETKTKEE